MNCYPSKLFSSITVLTSRPTNYAPTPTTSRTIPEDVTLPCEEFIPFTVLAPETLGSPSTEIIYLGPPTNFPTNSVNFEEEAMIILQ